MFVAAKLSPLKSFYYARKLSRLIPRNYKTSAAEASTRGKVQTKWGLDKWNNQDDIKYLTSSLLFLLSPNDYAGGNRNVMELLVYHSVLSRLPSSSALLSFNWILLDLQHWDRDKIDPCSRKLPNDSRKRCMPWIRILPVWSTFFQRWKKGMTVKLSFSFSWYRHLFIGLDQFFH